MRSSTGKVRTRECNDGRQYFFEQPCPALDVISHGLGAKSHSVL